MKTEKEIRATIKNAISTLTETIGEENEPTPQSIHDTLLLIKTLTM
jgi:predicted RNase H-like HicB family nuclease